MANQARWSQTPATSWFQLLPHEGVSFPAFSLGETRRYTVTCSMLWYCRWFRNPKANHLSDVSQIRRTADNEINYQPQLVRWIAEASTVCSVCTIVLWFKVLFLMFSMINIKGKCDLQSVQSKISIRWDPPSSSCHLCFSRFHTHQTPGAIFSSSCFHTTILVSRFFSTYSSSYPPESTKSWTHWK